MKLTKWFIIFSIVSSICNGADKFHEEELNLALHELKSASKSIRVNPNSYNPYELKAKIGDRIKEITKHCSNPAFADAHRTHSQGQINLAFTCVQKNTYKSSHPMMQDLFPEGDIIYNYLATLNERGEILALVAGTTNLSVEEREIDLSRDQTYTYLNKNPAWDDILGTISLEVLYAGYGYQGISHFSEKLFPGEHDKFMHMITGKMISDFGSAIAYSTSFETNRQNPWRSKLVGLLAIAVISSLKEVGSYYTGLGTPEVRDAAASTFGGLVTSFSFHF